MNTKDINIKRGWKQCVIAYGLTVVMILSALVGVPQTGTEAMAAGKYGISGPRRDSAGTVTYDCVYFGNYWQIDTNGSGKANKQDDKTPIKWRVMSVDGDNAFLIADQILDVARFDEKHSIRNWSNCTMRSWLNGYGEDQNADRRDYSSEGASFISNAFTKEEQAAIYTTTVVTPASPVYNIGGGSDTKDKIYLLSDAEIANTSYGFANYDAKTGKSIPFDTIHFEVDGDPRTTTIYDYAKLRSNTEFCGGSVRGSHKNLSTVTGNGQVSPYNTGSWWLRSPGMENYLARAIGTSGLVEWGSVLNYGFYGVCPVLHLNLSKTSVWKKADTVSCKSIPIKEEAPKVSVSKVKRFKATAKKKALKLTWNKVSGASGYQLQYSTKSNFKSSVKSKTVGKTKSSITIKKLKTKKKYYIRIRAYKTYTNAEGKKTKAYSKWVKINKKTK